MSMQPTWISILNFLPTLMLLTFLLAAVIFVAIQRNDGSSAKMFALFGLGIMLLLRTMSFLFNYFVVRAVDVDYVPIYFGTYYAISTLLDILALVLLIAAVFTGRNAASAPDGSGGQRLPGSSSNPYSPPVN